MILESKEQLRDRFLNSEKFFEKVKEFKSKELSYMDSVMLTCDEFEINPDDLVKLKLVSPILKMHIQDEATEMGLLKKENTLF